MSFHDRDRTVTWTSAGAPRRPPRRLLILLLVLPFLVGSIGVAPNAPVVHGDELASAKARQTALKKQIASQKAKVAQLNSMQADLSAEIRQTGKELKAINADLVAMREKIAKMQRRIKAVQKAYEGLVEQGKILDAQLVRVQAEEAQKRDELRERQALLAERIRSAYDTDRVSLLESFLSGATFTDMLTQMSYLIDVGEQDKVLAQEIVAAQATLAAVSATVASTREATDELRKETAAQKRELDRNLKALKDAQAQLKKLEAATKKALAAQKKAYEKLAKNKKNLKSAIAKGEAAQRALKKRIDSIIAKQARAGKIPSEYNGTFRWPMVGRISGEFGCSSYPGYGPGYGCAHFHNGIDIVAPYGTPVKAAGAGTVVYIGWNYADGSDPAWIVVIAHSQSLRTWYAHMQPRRPVSVGQHVKAGQVIGYEGNTGRSTGAHLHWMVELNGTWKNPRLFL
jgi:murein DD-endopeptidase MepM/ murein hydrolase activator NlpD